jgi:hypothetical protein
MFVQELAHAFAETLEPTKPEFTSEELRHFATWCVASGMKPEGDGGQPFSLEGRAYALPLYDQTRDTLKRRSVKRKAAQLGLTVEMLYKGAYLTADIFKRCNVGFFFPTEKDVLDLHKTRFRPMMRSSARMMRLVGVGGVDAVEVVRIGHSNMRFRGMRAGTAVDSVPLDALLFDECRLMSVAMIERAFLRVSESRYWDDDGPPGIIDLNSTAGFPGMDIDYYFQQSSQHYWHVFCPNVRCKHHKGFIMEEAWPDCVDTRDPANLRYICPKCGTEIPDTQRGAYVRLGPADAYWDGYTFSKILKGPSYLPEMWQAYQRMVVEGQNPSEFYNSFLARPHRDPNAVIVTAEVFNAAMKLEPSYRWPEPGPHPEGWYTAIGIDQRPEEKHVTVWRLGPGGRVYLCHLEVVMGADYRSARDPERAVLERCIDIARQWQVDIGVVDRMPDYSFSSGFGRAFPHGVIWLAEYDEEMDQPLKWSDQADDEKIRKSAAEAKYEYIVKIDRYKHLLQAFNLFKYHRAVIPADAFERRVQEIFKRGQRTPTPLAAELREHLENIAKTSIEIVETDRQTREPIRTGRYRYLFKHLAVEPHFAHAYAYAIAGLMRRMGTTTITGARKDASPKQPITGDYAAQLPKHLRPRNLSAPFKRACASCKHFQPNLGGGLGWCHNPRVAFELGAPKPPVRTSPGMTNCRHYRKADESHGHE